MANFDSILAGIHAGVVKIEDKDDVITISDKRTFEVASDYNTVLAYAGDVNSQIVTFEIPESHEGHDLSQCECKKLKWKNKGSGAELFTYVVNWQATDGVLYMFNITAGAGEIVEITLY